LYDSDDFFKKSFCGILQRHVSDAYYEIKRMSVSIDGVSDGKRIVLRYF